jgi:hypothetical protein
LFILKPKKCKQCSEYFEPTRPLQMVCSPLCAIEYKKKQEQKKWRERKVKMKEELKTLTDFKKDLEVEINTIVRLLDKPSCVSCPGGVENAGHYHAVGSNDSIRFNLHNIHGQCVYCNKHKGSNLHEYDLGLISRYGNDYWHYVKFYLVADFPLMKFTKEQVQEATKTARVIVREMKKANLTYPLKARIDLRYSLNERIGLYL